MNETTPHSTIDPELEARIVAMVLGEASDFERDQLQQLIDQRPELAAFQAEMQAVHAQLQEIATGEVGDQHDDWKLPDAKRQNLLATISGEAEPPAATATLRSSPAVTRRPAWSTKKVSVVVGTLTTVAAAVMVIGLLSPGIDMARTSPRSASDRNFAASPAVVDQSAAASVEYFDMDMDIAETFDDSEFEELSTLDAKSEVGSRQDSRAALGALRGLLGQDGTQPSPYYLKDDVELSPSDAQLALPQEANRRSRTRGEAVQNGASIDRFDSLPPTAEPNASEGSEQAASGMAGRGQATRDKAEAEQLWGTTDLRSSVKSPDGAKLPSPSQAPQAANENALRFSVPSEPTRGDGEQAEGFSSGFGGAGGGFGAAPDAPAAPSGPPADRPREFGFSDPMSRVADSITPPVADEHFDRPGRAASEMGRVSELNKKNAPMSGKDLSRLGDLFEDEDGDTIVDQTVPAPLAATATAERSTAEPEVREESLNGLEYDFRAQKALEGIANLSKSGAGTEWYEGKPQATTRPQRLLEEAQKELPHQAAAQEMAGENLWAGYVPPTLHNPTGLNETAAAEEAFSTFSLHVSDVSFKLAQAALAQGEWPEPAKIRIEEFVNAFDYGDPMPSQSEKVACRVEQAVHPFLQQRNLLRVSMRTAAAGRASTTPLRLTLLLDNSGSMERVDRQQTVRRAFALLAQQLTPADRVTLISFARQPRLLADQVGGDQAQQLVERIESLPSEGGTNLEAALQLAFEKAQQQQTDGAQNRIVLLTDGAVNLGDANPGRLSQMIITMRDAGIAFDAAGISAEGLNDEVLEALTRKGDGRYYLLDSFESADDGFAKQLAGALRPSAKNVKVQVEFNPRRVGHYKLLGFEKHLLNKEDFRNDAVDAAEMAAAEAGVAVYQFEAKPDGEGDVGSVSVRFRDLSTGQMVENRWPIPYQADAPRVDQAAPSLQIATAAALLAAKLRGEPLGETVDLKTLSKWIAGLPERERSTQRIQQLRQMIEQTRQLHGQ